MAGTRQREKPVVKLFSGEKREPYERDGKGRLRERGEREREKQKEAGLVSEYPSDPHR